MNIPDGVIFIVGLLGFILVIAGLWQFNPAVALVAAGSTMTFWSWFVSKAKATHSPSEES